MCCRIIELIRLGWYPSVAWADLTFTEEKGTAGLGYRWPVCSLELIGGPSSDVD